MERKVRLYEPNANLAATQEALWNAAKELDGLQISLREAVERIQEATSETVEVMWRLSYIRLTADQGTLRVIRYRSENTY